MASFILKQNRDRNRSMSKMPKGQLSEALAASDRIYDISCEIRNRHSKPPLERSLTYRTASARMGDAKPVKAVDPAQSLGEIAKRRKKLDRDREKLDADIKALIESRAVPMAMIARSLGVSRQRIYQLAA
ncbi:MAG: hypothetical protein JST59_16205 [Actinobacteria bacterium]|nr:hypothetical protein [Actinomycetota bacterium]